SGKQLAGSFPLALGALVSVMSLVDEVVVLDEISHTDYHFNMERINIVLYPAHHKIQDRLVAVPFDVILYVWNHNDAPRVFISQGGFLKFLLGRKYGGRTNDTNQCKEKLSNHVYVNLILNDKVMYKVLSLFWFSVNFVFYCFFNLTKVKKRFLNIKTCDDLYCKI